MVFLENFFLPEEYVEDIFTQFEYNFKGILESQSPSIDPRVRPIL